MNEPVFRDLKRRASVLKLRAGRETFENRSWQAIVAYHHAADLELLAAKELADDEDLYKLTTLVEACGLYLDARDPASAALVWKRIPPTFVRSDVGSTLVKRVRPALQNAHGRFVKEWTRFQSTLPTKSFEAVRFGPVQRILALYPGIAGLWWASYRYFEMHRDWISAARELRRAMELAPGNRAYISMAILLESHLRPPAKALRICRSAWLRSRDSAAVNQTYALALLRLTRTKPRRVQALAELDHATLGAVELARGTRLETQAKRLREYVQTLLIRPPTEEDFTRLGVVRLDSIRSWKSQFVAYEESLIATCVPKEEEVVAHAA